MWKQDCPQVRLHLRFGLCNGSYAGFKMLKHSIVAGLVVALMVAMPIVVML
jgi:hypothetical protein